MRAALHKTISYLLLCIALLPLIFAVYIQMSESVIHHQMKEALEQKNLVTVHIKSSQIVWIEEGKEASINGDMFDVEKYLIKGNDIELTGLFDKAEDALFAQINNSQQNNTDATGSISVLKWFGCFNWNTHQTNLEIIPAKKILAASLQQNHSFKNPVLSCDTPPPKSAII